MEKTNGIFARSGQFFKTLFESSFNWRNFYVLLLSGVVAYIITPKFDITIDYQEGDVGKGNIKVSKDYVIIDHIATENKRIEAENSVKPVYDFDEEFVTILRNKVQTALNLLGEVAQPPQQEAGAVVVEKSFSPFKKIIGIDYSNQQIEQLMAMFFSGNADFYPFFLDRLEKYTSGFVIPDNVGLLKHKDGIVVRRVSDQKNVIESTQYNFDQIKTAAVVKKELYNDLIHSIEAQHLTKKHHRTLKSFIGPLVNPNFIFNAIETNLRKEKARQQVKVLKFNIKKGEMILRDGERVRPKTLQILSQIKQTQTHLHGYLIFTGLTLFLYIFITQVLLYSERHLVRFHINNRDILFFICVLLINCLFISFWKYIGVVVFDKLQFMPLQSYYYFIPFAFGAMQVRIVHNSIMALIFSIIVSMLSGLILENNLYFSLYTFVGCLVGTSGVAKCFRRSTLIMAGLKVGLVNIFVVMAITLVTGAEELSSLSIAYTLVAAFLGGLLGGVFVTGLTPVVESVFGYVTDFQLLELSNMNHPIMKELIIHAPGTYAHSIMVGSLVEAAAEDIGANPLLCRVGSYYHDIGKIKKPLYFIENQVGSNRHDKLSPRLSSLIIIAHVKDGIELAKAIGLPKPIRDIIQQHHGSSRIDYFYRKAIERAEADESINESDFRYPGPKPQTREAGLVHLADMVQAASQSLADKSPARLQGLIQKIINKAFTSGQLDECDLTLRDLHKVTKAFYRIFGGIYHYRVDYPDKATKGSEQKKMINMVTHAMLNDEPKHRQKQGEKEDLKRLGQDVEQKYG